MKTGKKALLLALCAVLLVAATVMGTMAYLTYTTEAVVNTFTIGKVAIKLDEAEVDLYGKEVTPAERVKKNDYKLMPGHTYVKDPTVTVEAKSEPCYVRMHVAVSDITKLTAAFPKDAYSDYYGAGDVFLLEKLVGGWDSEKWVSKKYENGTYDFWYKDKVDASNSAADVKLDALFTSITVPESIKADGLANLADVKITVTADAIQADSFTSAEAAWTAFDQAKVGA